jgi:hypothetical protein
MKDKEATRRVAIIYEEVKDEIVDIYEAALTEIKIRDGLMKKKVNKFNKNLAGCRKQMYEKTQDRKIALEARIKFVAETV